MAQPDLPCDLEQIRAMASAGCRIHPSVEMHHQLSKKGLTLPEVRRALRDGALEPIEGAADGRVAIRVHGEEETDVIVAIVAVIGPKDIVLLRPHLPAG